MASDPYRVKEPDTCSHCGADATRTCEDGERYCEHCLPPVRLVPVHEDAALRDRAAALEVALADLVDSLPKCEREATCEQTSVAVVYGYDGRVEYLCERHAERPWTNAPWASAARAAQALLGAGDGVGG